MGLCLLGSSLPYRIGIRMRDNRSGNKGRSMGAHCHLRGRNHCTDHWVTQEMSPGHGQRAPRSQNQWSTSPLMGKQSCAWKRSRAPPNGAAKELEIQKCHRWLARSSWTSQFTNPLLWHSVRPGRGKRRGGEQLSPDCKLPRASTQWMPAGGHKTHHQANLP